MNTWYHCQSAAKKWGGIPEDFLEINSFIDSSKRLIGDVRHRSIYHHTEGTFLCEKIFGVTIEVEKNTKTVLVPVRLIAEQHIIEDLGWLPSPADYIKSMDTQVWMSGSQKKIESLSKLGLK